MELYFNMFKIRYLLLNELINEIEFTAGEEINIFINLETIMKKVTSTTEDGENLLAGPKRNLLFTSCVFNLVAHYRNFFNKHKVCSKVYIYGPESLDSEYLNRVYIEDYRKNSPLLNRDSLTSIGNTYTASIKFIRTIFDYVEGVYFITSGVIEPSVIPLIINKHVDVYKKKNFIVTDDRYEFQYTRNNYYILKPRLEKSKLISKDNVMDVIKERTKCSNIENPDVNFIPFVLSILGDKYRDIPKIKRKGISTIYKEINKGVEKNIVNDKVENILSLLEIIDDKDVHNQISLNYLSTNIFEQEKRLSASNISYIKSQLVDKFDSGYLRNLNDEFFMEFPLNIIEITRGVKNSKRNKVKWRN